MYGFIHIEYKIVYTSKLFNLCYKTSRNRWEKETTAVCVYFGQKSSIPFALVLWRKVDGRGKELVSAYILKIKLKSFTQEKLNSTVAARLKAQGLWQTPIL